MNTRSRPQRAVRRVFRHRSRSVPAGTLSSPTCRMEGLTLDHPIEVCDRTCRVGRCDPREPTKIVEIRVPWHEPEADLGLLHHPAPGFASAARGNANEPRREAPRIE